MGPLCSTCRQELTRWEIQDGNGHQCGRCESRDLHN